MKRVGLIAFALVASCFNPANPPVGFYCHPDDNPACPDGTACKMVGSDYRCVATGDNAPDMPAMSLIPKTGSPYSGQHTDPGLSTMEDCNGKELEPNDTPGTAIDTSKVVTMVDATTPKITNMAICPKGPRADTGNHDVDYYRVDTAALNASGALTLMAEIFYDVSYGDLDVGVFDETGRLLSGDGSAVTNGCTAASVQSGIYYVVVTGANSSDVNRYQVRIRAFSTPHACPTPGLDGGI